jgi:hypothetical protein
VHLRERGLHIWDSRPFFLTLAHTDADLVRVIEAFRASVRAMQEGGFFPRPHPVDSGGLAADAKTPPVPGARLGRDPHGNPAWFVPDPERPGRYLKL